MTPSNKKMLELCTIICIPEFTKAKVQNGRLKRRYQKLEEEIEKELKVLPKMSTLNRIRCDELLQRFFKETGWEGHGKHIATLASFCLGMLEDSEFEYNPKITDILNDIVDYFDRAGKAPGASFWSGSLAVDKWNLVIGEV